jgi:hypothetical protein
MKIEVFTEFRNGTVLGEYTEQHYVCVRINGVTFRTSCQTKAKALQLAVETAGAVGIQVEP